MNASETRILIADSDPRMAMSLKLLLEATADQIFIARSLQETEGLLEAYAPDLLLADVALVGAQVGGWLSRMHLSDPSLPVLLMTTARDRKSATQAYSQGAYDLLNKPFEPVELIRKIGQALEERRLTHCSGVIRAKRRTSPLRYKFLVENSPDIIYALDHRGRFTFANQTLDRLLGFSPESLLGKPYRDIVDPRD
ncbi:MAG: response regulator, partial [Desulfobacterales bacterium]